MGFFLFQNGSVYYRKDNQSGVLATDVFKSSPLAQAKEAVVFFTEVDAKRITAADSDPVGRDEKIRTVFPTDMIAQSERIGANSYQVFGANSTVIRNIYATFGKENIKKVVPYSIGIRNVLIQKGLVPAGKTAVVLDDLGDKYILTIFQGLEVTESREISQRIAGKVVEEVLRSQKEYESRVARDTHAPEFFFISNNKGICDAVVEVGLYLSEATAYFEGSIPVFEAKVSELGVHFSLLEDVLRLRKLKELKKNSVVYMVAGGVIAGGLLYFIVGLAWYGSLNGRVTELSVKETQLQREIDGQMADKYRDVIRHSAKPDLLKIVDSFRQNIPFAFSIEQISMKDAVDRWEIQGIVYSDRRLLSDFGDTGVFKDRTIENIFVRNLPAQKVSTVLRKGE